MNENEINDKRNEVDFRGISFSKFKKTDVRKELLNSLKSGKVEPACYWSAELICAGHYPDLWDIIITFMSKHIHLANPKLCIYIDLRFGNFKQIVTNGYIGNELRMRNNHKIRSLFGEIICILCNSKKKHSYEGLKIKKKEEFDITQIHDKLKAPNIHYADQVFLSGDPKELFIPINEFAYHVSKDSKNSLSATYWFEWLLEFEMICKIKKQKCVCERRSNMPVDDKYQMDPIWIIWEIIQKEAITKGKLVIKIINSLLNLYSLRFSDGVKKKRRYIIYFAISLLTDPFDQTLEIIDNKELIDGVVKKIDLVYKQVKKNEESPKTEYLNSGGKSDLDKTIEKLDKINSLNTIIRDY